MTVEVKVTTRLQPQAWHVDRRTAPRSAAMAELATRMQDRSAGYEIAYECPQPTPMLLMLSVHPSRQADLEAPHRIAFDPPVAGDRVPRRLRQHLHPRRRAAGPAHDLDRFRRPRQRRRPTSSRRRPSSTRVEDLPDDVLVYLLGSRYCDTDRLIETWPGRCSAGTAPGWARVQAICDYVHDQLDVRLPARELARAPPGTAISERRGVCRDFAHLAITLCRCMNIPARYCTGYLGDIGVPPDPSADGLQRLVRGLPRRPLVHASTPATTRPRIGRILMARGRDATDVALSTSFGASTLAGFKVTPTSCRERVRAGGTTGRRR